MIEARWNERLEELKAFFSAHGHSDVPKAYKDNPPLGCVKVLFLRKKYWELMQQLENDNSTSIIRHNNAESLSNRTAGKKKMNRPVPKERIEKLVSVEFKL